MFGTWDMGLIAKQISWQVEDDRQSASAHTNGDSSVLVSGVGPRASWCSWKIALPGYCDHFGMFLAAYLSCTSITASLITYPGGPNFELRKSVIPRYLWFTYNTAGVFTLAETMGFASQVSLITISTIHFDPFCSMSIVMVHFHFVTAPLGIMQPSFPGNILC